ncbi:GNAT family N-acetyltransferase [Kitasatospora sp. McL0602]|uniref:GNAT family N-acetyltransferase n=1 Tax=Kitasatospora sp. McL0602 TaxID=3439530 RepID=UPI003F8C44F7
MERPLHVIDLGDLTLRRWEPEQDLDELVRVIDESVEHLRPFMPWAAEHSREATAEYLAGTVTGWASGEAHNYAIVSGGRVVGNSSFFRRDPADDPARREIGYWLHPAATGRGLATRAAEGLVREAFALPGVTYVEIVHDEANTASGAVPRRLGFTEHRRRACEPAAPGESGTDVIWRLTRQGG